MTAAARGPRDRPLSLPPKGTGWGLVSILLMAAGTPLMGAMALSQWSARGSDLWLDHLNWLVWPPMVLPVLPAFGWGARRFWAIAMWWTEAAVLAVAFPAVLVLAALVPLGIVSSPSPDPRFMHVYPFGFLLCMVPLLYPLLRLVRLNYFKPWSRPESWEIGEEAAPGWALKATGAISASAKRERDARRAPRGRRP